MSFSIKLFTCVSLLLAWSSAYSQAPDILPGLWENTVNMSSKSGRIEQAMEAQKQMMASMPAEQRKMMEDMMKQRGMDFDIGNRTMKSCLTEKDINEMSIGAVEDGCKQEVTRESSSKFSVMISCPDDNVEGKGEYTIQNNKQYSGKMVMDINMMGQPDTITTEISAKWLGADCGNVSQ